MGWMWDDLPDHEGYLGYRVASDLSAGIGDDPPPRAGDVVGYWNRHVHQAGIDAMVPACECGWQGTPVPVAGVDEAEDLRSVARIAWRTEHAAGLLAAAPPYDLGRELDGALDRVAELAGDRPVAALALLRQITTRADRVAHAAAGEARRRGSTWEEIGAALGVSRQAAAERFRRPGLHHAHAGDTVTMQDAVAELHRVGQERLR